MSQPSDPPPRTVYRHRLLTRLCHWINLLCLAILLPSGLQIFNAHPRLYWGQYGANADPAVMEMVDAAAPKGGDEGVTRIGPVSLVTTGLFGLSMDHGYLEPRGFPTWMTLPSYQDLATGRHWHFFFAWLLVINGAVYLAHAVFSRHLTRDLLLTRDEAAPRRLWRDLLDHLMFKTPKGEASARYNPLQKIAYLGVIFILLPLMLITGLTLTPGMDAAWPWLLDFLGGRQSARTLHFITANLIVLFVLIHVLEVMISGPVNEMRSMITGRWTIRTEKTP
jgi:thiosulfate reductase cytochrome b subunit